MSIVVFAIMPGRVHGFLRKLKIKIRKEEVRISASPQTIRTDCFSKQRDRSVSIRADSDPTKSSSYLPHRPEIKVGAETIAGSVERS